MYVIVDLEWTCCDDNSIPSEESEIIEIGAVALSHQWDTLGEFGILVKPEHHPQLTPFCSKLTGISQAMVDNAKSFFDVYHVLDIWCDLFGKPVFCSWGNSDWKIINRAYNARLRNVADTFDGPIDLSRLFRRKYHRLCGHRKAMTLLGMTEEGPRHRGLVDARNIARMAPLLLEL